MDRATAPPSEASTIQEAPPPEAAVAEPTGDASHEAGTAASPTQETTTAPAASDTDTVTDETSSLPDRPAGAVEETPDTDVPLDGALEAMMAAVLFRPAPAPEQAGLAPSLSDAAALAPSGGAGVATVIEAAVTTAAVITNDLRESSTDPVDLSSDMVGTEAPVVAPDVSREALGDAMRLAAQAAQHSSAWTKGTSVRDDASVTSMSEAEMPSGTANVVPDAGTTDSTSTPLSLLEGMSDVEVVEVRVPSPLAAVAIDDSSKTVGERDEAATSLQGTLAGMPVANGNAAGTAAPVAAAKPGGVTSLPVAAQVAETVRSAVLRGDHEIRLVLNPGDLGQIDIRISQQGGVLQLRLEATKGSTHDLLAREMPALRQALEARDLRIERIQVSNAGSTSTDGSGSAWGQGSGRHGQQRQERDGSPAWSPIAALDGAVSQPSVRRAPRVIRHHGVLDRVA